MFNHPLPLQWGWIDSIVTKDICDIYLNVSPLEKVELGLFFFHIMRWKSASILRITRIHLANVIAYTFVCNLSGISFDIRSFTTYPVNICEWQTNMTECVRSCLPQSPHLTNARFCLCLAKQIRQVFMRLKNSWECLSKIVEQVMYRSAYLYVFDIGVYVCRRTFSA